MSNKLHIILAGGKATRLGYLSKGTPKALMPLGSTTLLHRQVEQSIKAGSDKILVATSKLFHNQIKKSLEDYRHVEVIYKTNDEKGPLSTLKNILAKIDPKTSILLTLGDIYFLISPFDKLSLPTEVNEIQLAAATAFDIKDLSLGGVLFADNLRITSLVKKAISKNKLGFKWSSTALFKAEIKDDLKSFLKLGRHELEDFFEYCRTNGYKTRFIEIPDFINVNKPEELQMALLYNLAETQKGVLSKNFTLCANKIRKEFLKKQNA